MILPTTVNAEGETCLHTAINQRHTAARNHLNDKALKAIIAMTDAGQVNAKDDRNITPLMLAIANQDAPAYQSLLLFPEVREEINTEDQDGNNTLVRAVQMGDVAAVQALLNAGANPFALNRHGNTPFHAVLNASR